MKSSITKRHLILGWAGVSIVLVIASLWAYWGGIENFYEGWYSESIWENILMMIIQYWLLTLIFLIIGIISIRFPKVSLPLCAVIGIAAAFVLFGAHFSVIWLMIIIPLVVIGLLFFFGRVKHRKIAYILLTAIPAAILIITSIFGLVRVYKRVDDGNYGQRKVETEEICLIWAPRGPGWPDDGASYYKAKELCAKLNEDGTEILDEEVDIWRLPTVEEAVASQMLHGKDAGGVWDSEDEMATYNFTPDKETPLWDPHSKVIYYWTDTMTSEDRAYIIVYDGEVYSRSAESQPDYLSFRAVKDCSY